MIISGAWAIDLLPLHFIIEVPGIGLRVAYVSPFRNLSIEEFTPYKGAHPRKIHGVPMPEYLYRFYGLEKNKEIASEVIHIRVTPTEKNELSTSAKKQDMRLAEYARAKLFEGQSNTDV